MATHGKSGPPVSAAASMRALLGTPPLIEGEDPEAYKGLYDHVVQEVAPDGPLEEIWVRDIVDLLWETLRLRRLKASLLSASAHNGLAQLLDSRVDWFKRKPIVEGWAKRDAGRMGEAKNILNQSGLDETAIHAYTLAAKLDTLERIDRMMMQTEARRNAAYHEIVRHREVLAHRLRDVSRDIEDAEFMALPPCKEAAE